MHFQESICEEIIQGAVNPIIDTIKDFLEQSGYEITHFLRDFASPNIEILGMRYFAQLSIRKNIHIDRYIGCLSSIFNVLDSELKSGIIMRYKRVANYNEMDNITAFMTEKLKLGMGDADLIESLIQNFTITVEEARQRLIDLLNEFQVEQGLYENKRLRIKNNPGFPVKISQDKFKSNIFIEADNIDNIYYLDTIPIYLDSLIRITQDVSTTGVPKQIIADLCKQAVQKEAYIMEDIVAPAEHPLGSNFSPSIVAEELQFEETPAADSDNLDDLLDFMGENEEEEEEIIQSSKGSPMQAADDDSHLFLALRRAYLHNKMYYLRVWLLRLVFPHLEKAAIKGLQWMIYYRKHYALEYLVKKGVLARAVLLKVWLTMTGWTIF